MSTRTIHKLKGYLVEKDKQIVVLISENELLKKEIETLQSKKIVLQHKEGENGK